MFNPVVLYSTYNKGMFLSESLNLFFSIAKSSIENMTNTPVDAYSNGVTGVGLLIGSRHLSHSKLSTMSCCWDING